MLAVGTLDGHVRLLEASTGQVRLSLCGPSGEVNCIALSQDGRLLASAGTGGSWDLWDVVSSEMVLHVPGHEGKDGCICVAGSPGSGRRTRADDNCTLLGHSSAVTAISFSPPNLEAVATGSWDRAVIVWARTGQAMQRLEGHVDGVASVAFSNDGTLLASGSIFGRTILVWDLRSGALQRKLADAHWRSVQSVSFTPDGRRLASAGGDCEVLFWDLEAGEVTSVLEPHRSYGGSVAISPDGKWLAFGGYDFSVRIWDAEMGQQILLLKGHDGQGGCRCQRYGAADSSCTVGGHRGAVFSVAFSPDGRTLVSGSLDGTCKAWDVVSGELLRTLDMWPSFYFVAVGRDWLRDESCLAFAMGLHARLGRHSRVRVQRPHADAARLRAAAPRRRMADASEEQVRDLEEGVARMILDKLL